MTTRWSRIRARLARRWPEALLGLALFGFLYQALCHSEAFVDDAAISFSYSRQLAETGELVHTASSERVEGFSNPSWTFLCALPFLLRMDPYMFARAVGVLSIVLAMLLAYRTARVLCPRSRAAAVLAPLMLGMAPCVPFWAMGGLETPLVALLLTWTVHQTIREERERARPWSGLLLAALALTRPEGILFAAPVVLYKLARAWSAGGRERRASLPRHGVGLVLLAVPVLAYLAFRALYFADWLPNTYFAKVEAVGLLEPEVGDRSRGLLYVGAFLDIYRTWLVLAAAPLALLVRGRGAEAVLVLATVAAHLAFVLAVNGDWMGDFRLFAMAMPAWALLASLGAQGLGDAVDGLAARLAGRRGAPAGGGPARLGAAVSAAAVLAFVAFAFLPILADYDRGGWVRMELVRRQGTGLEMVARAAGLHRASIAIPDVGGSALVANVHVLDTVGLTDRVIAREKGRPDRIRRYFFEEARPDLYQEHSIWKRYYNLPLHREHGRDYVPLPRRTARGLVLLGDNYIRREHLTGWRAEHDHGADHELGGGLRLLARDDPIATGAATEIRLLLGTDGTEREARGGLRLEARAPTGEIAELPLRLESLPQELFEPGARIRVRTFSDGPVEAIRLAGPEGVVTGWLAGGAGRPALGPLPRFVLHPRSALACGPQPRAWTSALHGRGRLQLFESCRPRLEPATARALERELLDRARRLLADGDARPAIFLLGRAELLSPTGRAVADLRRRAARRAHAAALEALGRGRLEDCRSLLVDALRADPQLARARALDLRLSDLGLRSGPDRRERADVARDRLDRDRSPAAVREALEALLEADLGLEAARLLAEAGPAGRPREPGSRLLAAEALAGVGLCEEALALLPPGASGCRAERVRRRAAVACGREAPPRCDEPLPGRDELVTLLDLEGDALAGWQTSGPLDLVVTRPLHDVSGWTGAGLIRTDLARGGPDASWSGLSPELEIPAEGLSVQVGGGSEGDGVSVSLVVDGREVRRGAGRRDPHLRRLTWDVSDLVGRRARLRVEDRGRGEWGFLFVDELRAHPLHYFDPERSPERNRSGAAAAPRTGP